MESDIAIVKNFNNADDDTCSIQVSVFFCRDRHSETSLFVPAGTSYL